MSQNVLMNYQWRFLRVLCRFIGDGTRFVGVSLSRMPLREFKLRNVSAQQMVMIPLVYKGVELNKTYVIDILVEDEIIIEMKAHEGILPVDEAQLISYLKLADKRLGFLINFNVPLLKNGFKRFVNNF